MIIYRKGGPLRIRRSPAPEPPFWAATALSPYSARRAMPVSIDYLDLRASAADRAEVTVCDNVTDELERGAARLASPVLIDATEFAEAVFGRGGEALRACTGLRLAAAHLVSTRSDLPREVPPGSTVIIAAWPLDFARLEDLFVIAQLRALPWGAAVPVMFPVTTNLAALEQLAQLTAQYGARYFGAIPIEADQTAKGAMASSLALEDDDETYAMLFHADLEPLHTATERHVAALADAAGMLDFIPPPGWPERTNWNASVLLALTASRMMAMERDIELAGTLARSARAVAELEKPLARIAEAASLSIVGSLDEVSAGILSEWLEGGRPLFVERVNAEWRLRRDVGVEL